MILSQAIFGISVTDFCHNENDPLGMRGSGSF